MHNAVQLLFDPLGFGVSELNQFLTSNAICAFVSDKCIIPASAKVENVTFHICSQ